MQYFKKAIFLITILTVSYNTAKSSSFNLKAGLGYDYLSQEFFNDSLIVGDSILNWSQKTEFLNDFKGFINLEFKPPNQQNIEASATYEQSNDFMRFKSEGYWHKSNPEGKLELKGELEIKKKVDDSTLFGDDYKRLYLRARFNRNLNASFKINTRLYGEIVNFDSSSNVNYDHHRIGTRLAIEKTFSNFSYLDGAFFVNTRQVPNATENNYVSIGLESSYMGMFDWGDVDIYTRYEKKDYQLEEDGNDFKLFSLENRNKLKLSESFSLKSSLDFDYTVYMADISDLSDYYLISLDCLISWENLQFSVNMGPTFETLVEFNNSSEVADASIQDTSTIALNDLYSDEYTELGFKAGFEYINTSNIFFSVESETGKRDYSFEDDIVTDHAFQRFDIIADIKFPADFSLNLFFSSEWEWHDKEENNSTLYLISTTLTHSF